jgi:hypothetical protein
VWRTALRTPAPIVFSKINLGGMARRNLLRSASSGACPGVLSAWYEWNKEWQAYKDRQRKPSNISPGELNNLGEWQ